MNISNEVIILIRRAKRNLELPKFVDTPANRAAVQKDYEAKIKQAKTICEVFGLDFNKLEERANRTR